MVLRRSGPEASDSVPSAEFVEELVRKSLAINKQLRNGQSTAQYLEAMRLQAKEQVTTGSGKAPAAAVNVAAPAKAGKPAAVAPKVADNAAPAADPKGATMAGFLRQRSGDLEGRLAEVRKRRQALDKEEADIKQQAVDDIVDMLTVIGVDGDLSGVTAAFTKSQALLSQLGVRDIDLLKAAKKRG